MVSAARLAPLAETRGDLHLVAAEAGRFGDGATRRFIEAREAYWNADTAEAVRAWEELGALGWKQVPEPVRQGWILQAWEDAGDWARSLPYYRRFGWEESHAPRKHLAEQLARLPRRSLHWDLPVVSFPFELHGGQLVIVGARVNGRPARLLVDTGFSSTFLTLEFARLAGVEMVRGRVAMADANGSSRGGGMGRVEHLQLGGLTVSNLAVVAGPPRLLQRIAGPVDGVVGWDVLREMVVTWDFPGRRMSLKPSGGNPGPGGNLSGRQGPIITVVADAGRPLDLFLDTGLAARSRGLQLHRNRGIINSKVDVSRFRLGMAPQFSMAMSSVRVSWPRSQRPFGFGLAGHWFELPVAVLNSKVRLRENLVVADGVVGNAPFLGGRLSVDGPARRVDFEVVD